MQVREQARSYEERINVKPVGASLLANSPGTNATVLAALETGFLSAGENR